jgi:hypothetical protein
MPLMKGSGKKAISANIRELKKANEDKPEGKKRPMRQILAIALSTARKEKKD